MKIHVQGDRSICQDPRMVELLTVIAEEMKRHGDVAILGAYGDVAKVFADILGNQAICHGHRPKAEEGKGQCPESVEFMDCEALAAQIGYASRMVAWGIREGIMLTEADAFIFFPGAEGTLADLAATIAHCLKCAERGKPKQLALVGWPEKKGQTLLGLYGWTMGGEPTWFTLFDYCLTGSENFAEHIIQIVHG